MGSGFRGRLFFIVLGLLTLDARSASLSKDLYKRLEKSVFQIVSAHDENAPKSSYGTAYLIDAKNNLLVTNFHVVSEATRQKSMRLYLVDRAHQKRIEVNVVSINIINDLAVVQASETLKSPALELRKDEPQKGERTFSIGMPEDLTMSIVEGVFNGKKGFGGFEKYFLSTPLNSGMSGGPTVDSLGRVIATNVSVFRERNNISFAVPNRHLQVTLKEKPLLPSERHPAEISRVTQDEEGLLAKAWVPIAEQQMLRHQEELAAVLLQKSAKPMETPHWRFHLNQKELDCWSSKNTTAVGGREVEEACFLSDSSPLDPSGEIGNIKFSLSELDLTNSLSPLDFAKMSSSATNLEGGLFSDDRVLYFSQKCDHSIVVSPQKQSFSVNYCLKGFRQFSGLYALELQVRSLDPNKKHFVNFYARFTSFSKDNTSKLARWVIENLEEKAL
jgi:serine protease Do